METYKAGQGTTTASTLPADPTFRERVVQDLIAHRVPAAPAAPTMSSREIAELTGKRHDHVMRDIRTMLGELNLTGPSFGGSYKDSTGRWLPEFRLPKDLTITLVSGYSVAMRHRIVTRWMELEEQAKPKASTEIFILKATPWKHQKVCLDARRLPALPLQPLARTSQIT